MSFIAKYPGRCDDCREPIEPGDEVRYKGDHVLVHEVCDSPGTLSELDRDAQRPVCQRCWLLTPCECEDD